MKQAGPVKESKVLDCGVCKDKKVMEISYNGIDVNRFMATPLATKTIDAVVRCPGCKTEWLAKVTFTKFPEITKVKRRSRV